MYTSQSCGTGTLVNTYWAPWRSGGNIVIYCGISTHPCTNVDVYDIHLRCMLDRYDGMLEKNTLWSNHHNCFPLHYNMYRILYRRLCLEFNLNHLSQALLFSSNVELLNNTVVELSVLVGTVGRGCPSVCNNFFNHIPT